MKNLEHQERLLQFITELSNVHGYHFYKNFFDKLKKLVNQIKSKRTEMLEDFSEKMEKIHNSYEEEEIYDCLYNYYKNCKKFKKITDKRIGKANQELSDQIQLIINEMGLYNTVNYLYKKTNNNYIKKKTDKMMCYIKFKYRYYLENESIFKRTIVLLRGYGFIGMIKHIIKKICDIFRLWRIIRVFIPQKNMTK